MAVADVASASSEPTVSVSTRRQPRRLPWLTTPGWFRLAAVVLLAGLVALAVVSVGAALGRGDATDAVRDDATPLLVGAEDLYVALADADAAASTAFLRAGLEPEELRARYLDDLETAGAELALIAARTCDSAASSEAVGRIAQELPVYAGQVESARTNNRLDHPLGAAYLRRASDSMRNSMLPAATSIYEEAARRLYDAYDEGTSTRHRVTVLAVGGTVLVLLVAAQVLVALRTLPVPQPRSGRCHGDRRRPRRPGSAGARRAGAGAVALAAGGFRPAHRALDGPHPGAALPQRREPPPDRAGHRPCPPGRLRARDSSRGWDGWPAR